MYIFFPIYIQYHAILYINSVVLQELAKYGITCSFDYHTSEHFESPKKYSKPKASRKLKNARVKDDVDADVDVDANADADQSTSQDPQPGADFGRSSFTSNSSFTINSNNSSSRNISSGFRITQDMARQKTLWKVRIALAQKFLGDGFDVFMTDIDAFWLKNPYPMIEASISSDIITSRGKFPSSVYDIYGSTICMGLIYIKSTEKTKAVWESLASSMRLESDDQEAINNLIFKPRGNYSIRFPHSSHALDRAEISRKLNGKGFFWNVTTNPYYNPISRITSNITKNSLYRFITSKHNSLERKRRPVYVGEQIQDLNRRKPLDYENSFATDTAVFDFVIMRNSSSVSRKSSRSRRSRLRKRIGNASHKDVQASHKDVQISFLPHNKFQRVCSTITIDPSCREGKGKGEGRVLGPEELGFGSQQGSVSGSGSGSGAGCGYANISTVMEAYVAHCNTPKDAMKKENAIRKHKLWLLIDTSFDVQNKTGIEKVVKLEDHLVSIFSVAKYDLFTSLKEQFHAASIG